jgi:hypothetical protein
MGGEDIPIHDLTGDFKNAQVDWTRRGRAFTEQFAERVQRIRVGLYMLATRNDSRLPVRDNNKRKKIIVPANGHAVKSGKFQNGIAARELTNYDHFHRRDEQRAETFAIFPSVLVQLFVLDLSATHAAGDRVLLGKVETSLNRRLRSYLRDGGHHDPSQAARSESRLVPGPLPSMEDLEALLAAAYGEFRQHLNPCPTR